MGYFGFPAGPLDTLKDVYGGRLRSAARDRLLLQQTRGRGDVDHDHAGNCLARGGGGQKFGRIENYVLHGNAKDRFWQWLRISISGGSPEVFCRWRGVREIVRRNLESVPGIGIPVPVPGGVAVVGKASSTGKGALFAADTLSGSKGFQLNGFKLIAEPCASKELPCGMFPILATL
jgi:hypothetical protein